jgi:hypothetical protein
VFLQPLIEKTLRKRRVPRACGKSRLSFTA